MLGRSSLTRISESGDCLKFAVSRLPVRVYFFPLLQPVTRMASAAMIRAIRFIFILSFIFKLQI